MISGTVNNRITSSAPRALIVDGHALAYRMYYALPEMISPSGEPTQAIFGFIKSLRRTVETLLPTHGAVVWDGGLSTMRLELLPEYKGQRPPMPDAFFDGPELFSAVKRL